MRVEGACVSVCVCSVDGLTYGEQHGVERGEGFVALGRRHFAPPLLSGKSLVKGSQYLWGGAAFFILEALTSLTTPRPSPPHPPGFLALGGI